MCLITSFINIDKQYMGLYFQVFALHGVLVYASSFLGLHFWVFVFRVYFFI